MTVDPNDIVDLGTHPMEAVRQDDGTLIYVLKRPAGPVGNLARASRAGTTTTLAKINGRFFANVGGEPDHFEFPGEEGTLEQQSEHFAQRDPRALYYREINLDAPEAAWFSVLAYCSERISDAGSVCDLDEPRASWRPHIAQEIRSLEQEAEELLANLRAIRSKLEGGR